MASPGRPALDRDPADAVGLRLHDLGSLGIQVDGVEAPIRGAKPARILTTLLVNANHRVSVDALLDAVWGEQVSDSTLGTLESHVWRLRKLMEPRRGRRQEPTYLVNDAGGYRLIVNPENADSLRFAQLAEQGDRLLATDDPDRALRRYELALTLWRGRPFNAVADEVWAAAAIARLEELYGQLHEQRVEALLRIGASERAILESEELIGRLPFRERLWSQLMIGLYRAGRVQEALGAYYRAREVALDTMGMEPGDELRQLELRILNQDPALALARPETRGVTGAVGSSEGGGGPKAQAHEVHLPSRLSALVGRADELEGIGRLLGRSRLVTLVGSAGCGKTRLAIEVARAAATLAPDGVWFVDLAAVDDPATIVDVVASTIGLEQPPVGTTLTALRSYVRDRDILLLVDNCEHLLPGVYELMDALLDEDSPCRILATSREPIGLDGEVLWTLAPLAVRDDPSMTGDEPSPAAQLFTARAQSVDPRFEPTREALLEVEAICAAVDGIPLAVELAAGRIRSASLAEVRQQVSTELAGLSRIGYARTGHHRTVELSIEWGVRLLSDAERAVHRRLSTLPGVLTVEAAQAVTATSPVRPADIPDLLTQLVHRSLLAVVPGDGPGQPTRFRQLATVRAHASAALADAGESAAARDRRTAFVADLIAARPPDEAEDTIGWYPAVARNHDTLTAVLHDTVYDRPSPLGAHLAGQLASYWFYQGRVAEGTRWLQAALRRASAEGAVPGVIAMAEVALACLLAIRDRTDLSLALVRSALGKVGADVDRRRFAYVLVGAAWCVWVRGDLALDFADDEVRRLASDDPVIEVWADVLRAKTALGTEGPVAVATRAAALVERAEQLGNISAAWLAAWLAVLCALQTGDADGAGLWLRRQDDYFRRLGGGPGSNSVEFEGNVTALAGDYEQAARLYGQSSRMAFRAGILWPISPATEPVLAQVRRALPADRFNAAWQAGDASAGATG